MREIKNKIKEAIIGNIYFDLDKETRSLILNDEQIADNVCEIIKEYFKYKAYKVYHENQIEENLKEIRKQELEEFDHFHYVGDSGIEEKYNEYINAIYTEGYFRAYNEAAKYFTNYEWDDL